MSEKITYYKVISSDNKSCHGGDFDWTDYLPQGDNQGKWTPEIKDTKECSRGYHVTRYWNMWYKDGCRVFECEVKGLATAINQTGVIEKEVAESIRLVGEIVLRFDKNQNTGNRNTGKWNTGDWNTGIRNTGDLNPGDLNTGNFNTGDRNAGNYNTGDWNTGIRNAGDLNTGDLNTGNFNTGNFNTGDSNTGNRNAGNRNAGAYNTGDFNTGDINTGNYNTGSSNTGAYNTGEWNTGDWNTGNWNAASHCNGYLNTVGQDIIMVFNKPCKRSDWNLAQIPDFMFFKLEKDYKDSFRKAYSNANDNEKLKLVKLPNFDADVFYEISGIKVNPENGQEVR